MKSIKKKRVTRRWRKKYRRRSTMRKKIKRRTRSLRRNKSRRKYRGGVGKAKSKDKSLPVRYQLITDVDDTLHPAGSTWRTAYGLIPIAGVDMLKSRSNYYPCVTKLHQDVFEKFKLPTVIVSANPLKLNATKIAKKTKDLHGDKADTEIIAHSGQYIPSTFSAVSNAVARGLDTMHRRVPVRLVIGGIEQKQAEADARESVENWDLDNYESMASVKINTIIKHVAQMKLDAERAKNPWEYRAIWIGDNGQGDLLAAEKLLNDNIIYAALIHYVEPRKPSGTTTSWYANRLFSFKNYYGAVRFLNELDRTNLGFLNCGEDKEETSINTSALAKKSHKQISSDTLATTYALAKDK